ncbi:MAG: 2-amino-4-hydroxy-6-hydroxymethyldihydropteridine diphosphokinase [Chlorobi bacterium]|nr:2-amino-4-hydroxy-6-hydroxymethyldihydropteridine diphosphokinase [Chlorobiota bacterium]
MIEAGLSLGCNIGDCISTFKYVIASLQYSGSISGISSLYLTEPWGVPDQPQYYNCVVVLKPVMPLFPFFVFIRELERRLGRKRKGDYRPRPIDIDILFFGNTVMNNELLTIPHARMHQRRFVLEPLAEVNPDWIHPVLKQSVRDILFSLNDPGQVSKLSPYPEWIYSSSING